MAPEVERGASGSTASPRFNPGPTVARLLIAAAILALVASPLLVVNLSALTQQWHYPTFRWCTIEHYTEVSDSGTPYAYSDAYDYNSCAETVHAKAEWCLNFYCASDGYHWHTTPAYANAVASGQQTIDIGRGWSYHVVGLPPGNVSPTDFSGDLPP